MVHGRGGLSKSKGPVASGTGSGSFSLGELPNLLYIVEEKRENFLFVIDASVLQGSDTAPGHLWMIGHIVLLLQVLHSIAL